MQMELKPPSKEKVVHSAGGEGGSRFFVAEEGCLIKRGSGMVKRGGGEREGGREGGGVGV